jgi:predicted double-glycine peptidase
MGHEIGMIVLAVLTLGAGVVLGMWVSPRRFWWGPFAVSFAMVLMMALARRLSWWEYRPGFRLLMDGRREYLLLGFNAGFSMFVLAGRLRFSRQRIMVCGIAILFAMYSAILPFVAPMLVRGSLLKLQTRIDPNGVCRQHTDYTCGPAATVTALRQFGIHADEGALAIDMHTSRLTGTDPDVLADVLNAKYGDQGLHCEANYFQTLDDLPKETIVLAIVRYSFLVNHFVVILKIDGNELTLADPLEGIVETTGEQFEERWMKLGVVMRK